MDLSPGGDLYSIPVQYAALPLPTADHTLINLLSLRPRCTAGLHFSLPRIVLFYVGLPYRASSSIKTCFFRNSYVWCLPPGDSLPDLRYVCYHLAPPMRPINYRLGVVHSTSPSNKYFRDLPAEFTPHFHSRFHSSCNFLTHHACSSSNSWSTPPRGCSCPWRRPSGYSQCVSRG